MIIFGEVGYVSDEYTVNKMEICISDNRHIFMFIHKIDPDHFYSSDQNEFLYTKFPNMTYTTNADANS